MTSTPLPPLAAHRWKPEKVLLYFDAYGGDGGYAFRYFSSPPIVMIYSDGQMFLDKDLELNGEYLHQVTTKHLRREEVCSILNAADRTDIFDYDPATFDPSLKDPSIETYYSIDGAGFYDYEINAWRSNYFTLYGVDIYVDERDRKLQLEIDEECRARPELHCPMVLPALRDFYNLIGQLHSEDLQVYLPQRLDVLMALPDSDSQSDSEIREWPLQHPSLAELYSRGTEVSGPGRLKRVILSGEQARLVFDVFDHAIYPGGIWFTDGKLTVSVYTRPLLPYENLEGYPRIPPPDVPELHCDPSDGVYPKQ